MINFLQKKYVSSLLITIGIFVIVFTFVGRLNKDRVQHLTSLQQQMSIDLMAVETQFDLLKTAPCSLLSQNILSRELGVIGSKLDFALERQGTTNSEVLNLKKHYSLLQVKDYLLMQELAGKCNVQIDSLLYFYTNDCSECRKQGYVLTDFKSRYPELRIYSFDMDLDFPVIGTFASLYDLDGIYPILIAEGKRYEGFQDTRALEEIFAEYILEQEHQEKLHAAQDFAHNFLIEQGLQFSELALVKHGSDIFSFTYRNDSTEKRESLVMSYDVDTKRFKRVPDTD